MGNSEGAANKNRWTLTTAIGCDLNRSTQHIDKLSKLGVRHARQLDAGLVEKALGDTLEDESHLRLLTGDDEA